MVNRKVTHLSDMRSSYLHHHCIGPVDDELIFLARYDEDAGHDYSVEFPLHFGGEQT